MKRKRLMITMMFLVILGIILLPSRVKAVTLQANGGTAAIYKVNDWLLYIREMQKTGGALGLTDNINGNLTSANTNLDIHMEKNTEFGAMAILSASAYGMGSTPIADGGWTTGNSTGIKININRELVAAGTEGLGNSYVPRLGTALGRYKNIYTKETVGGKVGDAIQTLGTWHGAKNNLWLDERGNGNRGVLMRSRNGSLFSYHGSDEGGNGYGDGHYNRIWASRAVVVVGSGI